MQCQCYTAVGGQTRLGSIHWFVFFIFQSIYFYISTAVSGGQCSAVGGPISHHFINLFFNLFRQLFVYFFVFQLQCLVGDAVQLWADPLVFNDQQWPPHRQGQQEQEQSLAWGNKSDQSIYLFIYTSFVYYLSFIYKFFKSKWPPNKVKDNKTNSNH